MKVKLADIVRFVEEEIPLAFQEDYDNSGLQVGNPGDEIESAILSLDVSEEVVDEAIQLGCGLIISHHPVIFSGLKKLTGDTQLGRIVIKAIKNGIAIYSAHTNLDVIRGGVSYKMADRLHLKNIVPLLPLSGKLAKIVVFVPTSHAGSVRDSMFKAGAGYTGSYDHCSYSSKGKGTFRASGEANPFVGERGKDHSEEEERIEVLVPWSNISSVTRAIADNHPYEEPAYDIIRLENSVPGAGMGVVGDFENSISTGHFLDLLAEKFGAEGIRYSDRYGEEIKRVALCGGSGSSLIGLAERAGADAFVSGDIKYHTFFDANGKLLVVDIGHHESEKYSLDVLYEIITKKIPKFAVRFSKINTNPVKYLPNGKSKSS